MDFGYFWTDTAFKICSPVNVVIWLYHPRYDMGHMMCDTDDIVFSP